MKQPDAFEKTVEKIYVTPCRTKREVVLRGAKLLRAHHRQVVRMVQAIEKDFLKVFKIVGEDDAHAQGMMDGVQCVLAELKAMEGK